MRSSEQSSRGGRDGRDGREEWALIVEAAANEFKAAQQQEKQADHQRRAEYREVLQQQIDSRRGKNDYLRQEDQLYYQQIMESKQRAEEEERKKQDEVKRKRMVVNTQNLRMISRLQDEDSLSASQFGPPEVPLQIGSASHDGAKSRKLKEEHRKLLEFYRQQQDDKKRKLAEQKWREAETNSKLSEMLAQQDRKRNEERARIKSYKQNQSVYQIYSKLNQEQVQKEQIYFERMVAKPMDERRQALEDRENSERSKRERDSVHLRGQILRQIDEHKVKKEQPGEEEGLSIGNEVRKGKQDTKDYLDYWKQQIEERRRREREDKYMTDLERKLNVQELGYAEQGKLGPGYSPLYIGKRT